MADGPVDQGDELAREYLERCRNRFAARNHHDVGGGGRPVGPEHLAKAPLGAITVHGAANLPAGSYPKPRRAVHRPYNDGHQASVALGAAIEHRGELASSPKARVPWESPAGHHTAS
ncbi:MAG: hypothetical protein R2708_03265 [Vicinamibacterales bacterium]